MDGYSSGLYSFKIPNSQNVTFLQLGGIYWFGKTMSSDPLQIIPVNRCEIILNQNFPLIN